MSSGISLTQRWKSYTHLEWHLQCLDLNVSDKCPRTRHVCVKTDTRLITVTKRTVVFHRNESFMYEKEKAYDAWHEILHRARHGRVAFDSRPGEFFGISGYHELHCVVSTVLPTR